MQPNLLSIIDNIIGIHLTPEADEKFSLCDNCIKTMETFVTFRNKSRSNYETVREAKIMNEAMKRLQPLLQLLFKKTFTS
uniref:ZAD domain-containing protein n=1 Tax=Anopheles christyi TaxID=43041 RepID=A0A182K0J5_9DIPT